VGINANRANTLAEAIDPSYAPPYGEAERAGLEILAYRCRMTTQEPAVRAPLPIRAPSSYS